MLSKFIEYANINRLFNNDSRLLLAVSGGIDSMVMASLFRETGIKHGIAHCNFSLRDKESDGDEQFVRSMAASHDLPFYSITFNTLEYAAEKSISVQMAARDLRYEWFGKIVHENGYDAVAVAHNLNDDAETCFINLLRGTGLNGLTGMSPRKGIVIRPLLFATRDEISSYATSMGIGYREDSSNKQIKYTRNRIRHRIIPELLNISPNALASITATIRHLSDTASIIETHIEELSGEILKQSDEEIIVNIRDLKKLQPREAYLFEIFRRYGLSSRQTGELAALLDAPSGKYLDTGAYRILKDRDMLVLTSDREEERHVFSFGSLDEMRISGMFSDMHISDPDAEPLPDDRYTACFDLEKINFPLKVRYWNPGDRFIPLGMTGFKKISDLLIDLKIPVSTKERVRLLLSDDNVAWVMGYRIDNRYKVTPETRKMLIVRL